MNARAPSIEVAPIRREDDGFTQCGLARAIGFGVYVRAGPDDERLAMHLADMMADAYGEREHVERLARALAAAFAWADALADHIGVEPADACGFDRPPAYAIEPQRDTFWGTPRGADGSTWFEHCEESAADHWAVFDTSPGLGAGPSLLDDFTARRDAAAFVRKREAEDLAAMIAAESRAESPS